MLRYILLVAVLVACSQANQHRRLLAEIDRLMMSDVDSARAMLTDIREDMVTAPDDVRNYYNLLCVKNDDRAMVTHTSDSLICSVVRYFEQSADKSHLAEAYYYAGRCYSDMMIGEKAMFYFQLSLLEDSLYVTDYLRSRIFAQMGYIYQRNGLLDEAVNMLQMAHVYCEQAGDTLGVSLIDEDMDDCGALAQHIGYDTLNHEIGVFRAQKMAEKARSYKLARRNRELMEKEQDGGIMLWPYFMSAVAVVILIIIYMRREKAVPVKPQPVRRSFYDKELGELIAARLSDGKTLRPADWMLIEERLHASFPTFKDSLYRLYNFSDTEYRICMLTKLEVSPSNIAKLLAIGTSSVSQSRLRMQQKVFGGQGTAKDWDNFVLSL